MALIDDPRAYILRLFQMEMREGRDNFCETFSEGRLVPGAPLEGGELVYAVYKSKYFFTPLAMLVKKSEGFLRIPWAEVRACTTFHGCGEEWSVVTLVDGSKYRVRLADMATGWSGRVSQLMHKMIERWGARSFQGLPLMDLEEYLSQIQDGYSLNPNLPENLDIEQIKSTLRGVESRDDVEKVWVDIIEIEADVPIASGIVILSSSPPNSFEAIAEQFGGDILDPVSENLVRKVGPNVRAESIVEIRWH
jgi:hypothetical protein